MALVAEQIKEIEISQKEVGLENAVRLTLTKDGKSTDIVIGCIKADEVKISQEQGSVLVTTLDGAPVNIHFGAAAPFSL